MAIAFAPSNMPVDVRIEGDDLAIHETNAFPDAVAADVAGIEDGDASFGPRHEFAIDVDQYLLVAIIGLVRLRTGLGCLCGELHEGLECE